jgi:hypothetical protein
VRKAAIPTREHQIHFDIHMSMHRNIITNYIQQDTMFLDLFISKDALHVSGGSPAPDDGRRKRLKHVERL